MYTDEPKYWYWEVIIILKKMMLTGAMTIIGSGSSAQLVIALLIVMVNLLLVLKLAPFVDEADDYLATLTSGQMFLTLLGGLLIMTDNAEKPSYDAKFMGFTMIIVNSFGFLALIFSLLMLHPKCRKRMNGPKVMSMAERKRKMDSTKVVPKYEEEVEEVDVMDDDSDLRNWGRKKG